MNEKNITLIFTWKGGMNLTATDKNEFLILGCFDKTTQETIKSIELDSEKKEKIEVLRVEMSKEQAANMAIRIKSKGAIITLSPKSSDLTTEGEDYLIEFENITKLRCKVTPQFGPSISKKFLLNRLFNVMLNVPLTSFKIDLIKKRLALLSDEAFKKTGKIPEPSEKAFYDISEKIPYPNLDALFQSLILTLSKAQKRELLLIDDEKQYIATFFEFVGDEKLTEVIQRAIKTMDSEVSLETLDNLTDCILSEVHSIKPEEAPVTSSTMKT